MVALRRGLDALISGSPPWGPSHLPPDWYGDALCAEIDPAPFFPGKRESIREAKKVCAACPVRAQCLEYAVANHERHGIWGGVSDRDRRKIERQRQAVA